MKSEENKVLPNRNKILKIYARFYTELYSSTLQDQHPSQRNTSPDSSEAPPIMTTEVKKTLNKNEKENKATGIDHLRSDAMDLIDPFA